MNSRASKPTLATVINDGRVTNGKLSAVQRAWIDKFLLAGGVAAIAYSIDEALATLERWGCLNGRAALRPTQEV
jgi:hypothetical protein